MPSVKEAKLLYPDAIPSEAQPWIREFLLEQGITFEVGPVGPKDYFDREYMALGLRGILEEFPDPSALLVVAQNEDSAKSAYKKVLMSFLKGRKHIVWRIEPQVEVAVEDRFRNLYDVYSRLTAYQTGASRV